VVLFSSLAAMGMATGAKLPAPAPPARQIPAPPKPAIVPAVLAVDAKQPVTGIASWYGRVLHGHYTASGERFNMYELTAAHRELPFGSRVRVTNLRTGRSVVVRINDRGPMDPSWSLDLSLAAARQLHMVKSGIDQVQMEVLRPVPSRRFRTASTYVH
jgi:rare lipoprotein A